MKLVIDETMFDKPGEEVYPDNLFRFENIAEGIGTLDDVTDAHVNYYRETGFLVVQRAFTPEEVQAALDGWVDLVLGKSPDFTGIQFEASVRDIIETLEPLQRVDAVRKLHRFVEHEPRLKAMAYHSRFLNVVTRLLGAEPELFADQALSKPPGIGREKPWHQDHAFFDLPLGTPIVGCWIALDEAGLDNGCMHVKPGTHKEGPVVHFKRRDWQICDAHLDLNRDVSVPLKPGGVLFFDGLIHHGTPANRSPKRRRALQFHYIPKGTPRVSKDERMAIFGSEGKDVTC